MTVAPRTIHRLVDIEHLFVQAADAVAAAIREAGAHGGPVVVALAGGSTPKGLYHLLATPEYRDRVDWSGVEFFWGDERAVPPDHEDSNYRTAQEALLRPLEIEPRRIHRMKAERRNLDAAARDYENEIADTFGVGASGPMPRFDLILLGMGEDGHTASLFPYTEALNTADRWVVANELPRLSTRRMTMTAGLINRARRVFFLVAGENKASMLAEVLEGARDPNRLPSQLICPADGGRTQWFIDAPAAKELKGFS